MKKSTLFLITAISSFLLSGNFYAIAGTGFFEVTISNKTSSQLTLRYPKENRTHITTISDCFHTNSVTGEQESRSTSVLVNPDEAPVQWTTLNAATLIGYSQDGAEVFSYDDCKITVAATNLKANKTKLIFDITKGNTSDTASFQIGIISSGSGCTNYLGNTNSRKYKWAFEKSTRFDDSDEMTLTGGNSYAGCTNSAKDATYIKYELDDDDNIVEITNDDGDIEYKSEDFGFYAEIN